MWGNNEIKSDGSVSISANTKPRSQQQRSANVDTLVGQHTEIVGDLRFAGGLHVDGVVKGNLAAEDESQSVLSLSQHGRIEGEVRVPTIVLDGTVVGDVYSCGKLEVGAHAEVQGNIHYNLIELAVGATVNGQMMREPSACAESIVDQDRVPGAEDVKRFADADDAEEESDWSEELEHKLAS
jgi:cytoskeletal protein CcmA (bactofilin family)